MNCMEWACCARLLENPFFMVTRRLLDIEDEIAKRGCERQTDALYFTRRVEYPWAFLQIPSDANVVLDAGGGAATFQYLLSTYVPHVYNVDLSQEWVNKVNGVKMDTSMFNNLMVKQGDMANMPFPDKMFDATVCISAIEHGNQDKVLQITDELMRVTKGPVLVTVDVGEGKEMLRLETLAALALKHRFSIPPHPNDIIKCSIHDEPYHVACIRLEVE